VHTFFIYGPKYNKKKKEVHVLLNFLYGQAKMAIWLSRKRKLNDGVSTDVVAVLKGLIQSRINIEYCYYKAVNDLDVFRGKWGIEKCLCDVDSDGCLQMNV